MRRIVPANGASISVKLEWVNPTGSMKDRMAQAVIGVGEASGRLGPGAQVVTLIADSGLKYLNTDVYRRA